MGVIFILALIAIIIILYFYYFRSTYSSVDQKTDNSTSSESADLNNSSNQDSTVSNNFDTKSGDAGNNSHINADSQSDPYSLFLQSKASYSNQRYDEALVRIDQAIGLKQDEPNFYLLKADILIMLSRKEDALQALDEGLAQNPGNTNISNKIEIITEIIK